MTPMDEERAADEDIARRAREMERRKRDRRMVIVMFYEGPFDILASALWSLTPGGDTILEVPQGSWRDRAAIVMERLDNLWREWYVLARRDPPRAWRRRRL